MLAVDVLQLFDNVCGKCLRDGNVIGQVVCRIRPWWSVVTMVVALDLLEWKCNCKC